MCPSPERRRWPTLFLGGLLALAPPGTATRAQQEERVDVSTIDIESLLDLSVQAVTRRVERASAAPATVVVLTADDLRSQGFRTLAEALGSVPGLFTFAGVFPQVGVRGMGVLGDFTTRLLVLVDGHPLANSVGTDLGRGLPVPLSALQRIEVIKGPAGSVYGPTALFGVVNLVTTGRARGIQGEVALEQAQGSLRSGEADLTWRGGSGAGEWVASASYFSTRGLDFAYPEVDGLPGYPAGGKVPRSDFGDAGNAYLRGRWRGLSASAGCGHTYFGLPATFPTDPRTAFEALDCFAEAGWQGAVAEQLTLMSRLSFDDFQGRAGRVLPEPPLSVGLFQDKGFDRWGSAELRADWRPLGALRVDLGATVRYHAVRHDAFSASVASLAARAETRFTEVNAWGSAELRLAPALALHGGVTVSHHSLFGGQVMPKLAAVWQPTPDDTAKAIWSMGFRPPTYVEGNFTDNFAFQKNPDLRPEQVSSAEVAYEHRLAGAASLGLSLFWNRYRDLIQYQTVPAPGLGGPPDPAQRSDWRQMPVNDGSILHVRGAEAYLALRWGRWLQGQGGLSLQHASGRRVSFPGLTANLALSSRAAWERLLLSLRATGMSARAKAPEAVAPGRRTAGPAARSLSALAALDLAAGLTLELSAHNLLDAANPSPATASSFPVEELPASPRTLRAALRGSF